MRLLDSLALKRQPASLLPWWGWVLLALAGALVLGVLLLAVFWAPDQITVHDKLIVQGTPSADASLKAITDTRAALVQAVGGAAVGVGLVVGLLTLRNGRQQLAANRLEHEETLDANRTALEETLTFNHESLQKTVALAESAQITDRFTKAIEQLGQSGKDDVDLRLGGIYALGQIAIDSEVWHKPVVEVLAAFVRQHASGLAPPAGDSVSAQHDAITLLGIDGAYVPLSVDVAAAVDVLSRRDRSRDKRRLDYHGADFRRIDFPVSIDFSRTDFNYAHMEFCRLMYADLRRCFFLLTDLRGADLEKTDLRGATLYRTSLEGADLKDAQLDGASLEHLDLTNALNLTVDQLKVAKVDDDTTLPAGIYRDALTVGAPKVSS